MVSALVVLASCLAGCGGGGGGSSGPDAAIDTTPTWWQPKVGEAKNWDIQLSAPIDVSTPRSMYDLDLWALVPSPTMIDYGDGKPVMVPAGALAGTIAYLHARTPPTIVICHLETGVLDLTLPDAPKFPGYKADPAMIPDQAPPASDSVIGWHVGSSAKRWLDIREKSRNNLVPIIFKRFDLARQIGCDGVEPDRNLAGEFADLTGFSPILGFESYSWFAEIATQGHARKLSTGMKNGHTLNNQPDVEADKFDWLMVERCGEDGLCDSTRAFINLNKAVLAIDYENNITGVAQSSDLVCGQQTKYQIADGIIKDVGLTKNVRTQCSP